jgi:CheY-like chemotaxis protein
MINSIQRVMMIDDDEDDRDLFLTIVRKQHPDLSLSTAINGEDAMRKLRNANSPPDLIFLDLNMPLMNGRQFIEAIKQDAKLQQIPIVILSTSSDSATISEMKLLGAVDFITKPDKYSVWEKLLSNFFVHPGL